MNGNSLVDWLHLGGHGLYVWSAYGITLGALVLEALLSRRRSRQAAQVVASAAP